MSGTVMPTCSTPRSPGNPFAGRRGSLIHLYLPSNLLRQSLPSTGVAAGGKPDERRPIHQTRPGPDPAKDTRGLGYSRVTEGCERCLVAHHEDGAVSVADDGVGDAAHQ